MKNRNCTLLCLFIGVTCTHLVHAAGPTPSDVRAAKMKARDVSAPTDQQIALITAACQNWPEYGQMMGGYYGGHISQEVVISPEDPKHAVNACFGGKPFTIRDEIYISREPYSRTKVRVLAGLDLGRMEDPQKRPDKDYAVSWVQAYGKGRVFYTTLGHDAATYWNPVFLQHLLAGVQFAVGDLEGKTTPIAAGS